MERNVNGLENKTKKRFTSSVVNVRYFETTDVLTESNEVGVKWNSDWTEGTINE